MAEPFGTPVPPIAHKDMSGEELLKAGFIPWEVSEETRRAIEEINRAVITDPNDPRLRGIIFGQRTLM